MRLLELLPRPCFAVFDAVCAALMRLLLSMPTAYTSSGVSALFQQYDATHNNTTVPFFCI